MGFAKATGRLECGVRAEEIGTAWLTYYPHNDFHDSFDEGKNCGQIAPPNR
jgi:hypothetical protein